jgi:uncharacterized protein (TIGR02145 family)
MRITIQITLAAVILIAGIFIGRMTVNNEKVTETETNTDSTKLLPAFKETKIGDQIWMVENLNVDTFRDGTKIPEVKTREEWNNIGNMGEPAWCYYDNDPKNGKKYGKLYNWYAVNNIHGLAPKGWHVPSDKEWMVLINRMDGVNSAGGKLKSKEGWEEYNYTSDPLFGSGRTGNGTDYVGFSAFPGGYRLGMAGQFDFYNIGRQGQFWSADLDGVFASFFELCSSDGHTDKGLLTKSCGLSVRCIKDSEPEK